MIPRLILILALAVTSVALGAARGRALDAGSMVLCSGQAVTVVAVETIGGTHRKAQLCPDMALALLGAVGPVPVVLPLPDRPERLAGRAPDSACAGCGLRPRQGRGPPAQG